MIWMTDNPHRHWGTRWHWTCATSLQTLGTHRERMKFTGPLSVGDCQQKRPLSQKGASEIQTPRVQREIQVQKSPSQDPKWELEELLLDSNVGLPFINTCGQLWASVAKPRGPGGNVNGHQLSQWTGAHTKSSWYRPTLFGKAESYWSHTPAYLNRKGYSC